MAKLAIIEYPDPRLRTRAVPVAEVDAGIRALIDDMLESMYAARGVGLAATQVNVHKRVLVTDVSEERNSPLAFVNPEVIEREGSIEAEEGCLSVPGIFDKLSTRAERIVARALGRVTRTNHREGKLKVGIVSGMLHPRYGGPVSVIAAHVEALKYSADVSIFGVTDVGDHEEIFASFPGAHQFPKCFPRRWFRGKGIYRALQKAATDLVILHAHMVWDFPVFAAWEAAKNAGKPFIVTPHSCLMDECRHNAQHKRLYKYFIAGRMRREATCVHVLNRDEEMACRDWGVTCFLNLTRI